ncbi:MAG: sigma-70 family RNA polymerase sigma factor [Paracoccaceae bacterium]
MSLDRQSDRQGGGSSGPASLTNASHLPKFVRENTGWMLAVAVRILQDTGLAEDAVQTAFAKILGKIDGFEGRSTIRTWMHRIVVNEALMILRKIKRRQEQSIDALLPTFDQSGCRIESDLAETVTPEDLLDQAQTGRAVTAAINKLPDTYRVVLCLRDIEGLSTAEVGEALGISEANVKVRLHRARAALKKLLEPVLKGHMP